MEFRQLYFAKDLMRFIANKYNLDWAPRDQKHVSSPFTLLTERGVEAYLHREDKEIIRIHKEKFKRCSPSEQKFRNMVYEYLTDVEIVMGKEKEILQICVSVARFASLSYLSGMQDAPDVAVDVIENILCGFHKRFGIDIFQHFNLVCFKQSV